MSHSSLERRALGIFPERTWLYSGSQLLLPDTAPVGAGDALAAQLLAQRPAGRWWRPRLDVTLSDEHARVVVLPWQDGLRTYAQQMRYAEACLDDAGAPASAGWVAQHGYRRAGKAGMAYALRADELDRLGALAAAHRLRLRSVLPVAALAYWRYPLAARGSTLVLLGEARRVSLLRFSDGALAAVDVQPCGGERALAWRRLLRRAQAQGGAVARISCWSADGHPLPPQALSECFPDARIEQLPHRSWE